MKMVVRYDDAGGSSSVSIRAPYIHYQRTEKGVLVIDAISEDENGVSQAQQIIHIVRPIAFVFEGFKEHQMITVIWS